MFLVREYQRKTQILTFCTDQSLITPIATIHTAAVDMMTRVILQTLSTDFTAVCTVRFITAVWKQATIATSRTKLYRMKYGQFYWFYLRMHVRWTLTRIDK